MILDGAEDAETVDDVVGNEVVGAVVRPAVVAVVVAFACLDVVGEGVWHLAVLPVAGYEVGDVVSDHPAEPAALLALVGLILADVGGGGHADLYFVRISAGFSGRVVDVLHGPLQDDAVGLAPREAERLRPVAGHPHVELAVSDPRYFHLDAGEVDRASLGQLLYDTHGFFELPQRRRLASQDAHHGVAAPDAADGAVAEHVVEGGEGGGRHGRVAAYGVGDEGPDRDPLRRREHLRVDHVRFLPEYVRIEGPGVREAQVLGLPGKFDDSARRWVRLERDAEIHAFSYPILCHHSRNSVHLPSASSATRKMPSSSTVECEVSLVNSVCQWAMPMFSVVARIS